MTLVKKAKTYRMSAESIQQMAKIKRVYQEFADTQAEKFNMVAVKISDVQVVEAAIKKEFERLEKEGYVS
ncbi:TPA: hypothetical protein ACGW5B_005827 [Bacillus paranthracis]